VETGAGHDLGGERFSRDRRRTRTSSNTQDDDVGVHVTVEPLGAVVRPDDVAAIGRWAAENDIWVLCDEIYEHLVYGDAEFASMPVVAPELGDRWIVVNGVAKTYAMTGWRVGWMISAPDVMDAAVNYQSQTTSNISNISQRAAVAALNGDLSAVYEMRTAFDRRRRVMTSMLNSIDGVSCTEPEGAFYCYPNVSGLLGRSSADELAQSSAELAEILLETIRSRSSRVRPLAHRVTFDSVLRWATQTSLRVSSASRISSPRADVLSISLSLRGLNER